MTTRELQVYLMRLEQARDAFTLRRVLVDLERDTPGPEQAALLALAQVMVAEGHPREVNWLAEPHRGPPPVASSEPHRGPGPVLKPC